MLNSVFDFKNVTFKYKTFNRNTFLVTNIPFKNESTPEPTLYYITTTVKINFKCVHFVVLCLCIF